MKPHPMTIRYKQYASGHDFYHWRVGKLEDMHPRVPNHMETFAYIGYLDALFGLDKEAYFGKSLRG